MKSPSKSRGRSTLYRTGQHKPVVRRDLAERETIIREFEEQRNVGVAALAAATSVGVSLPTVYRWLRDRDAARAASSPIATARRFSVDEAIAILVEGARDRFTIKEAIFKFTAWLRWPTRPADHVPAITSCLASYLHQTTNAETLADLDAETLRYVLQYVRLDTLRKICSEESFDFPIFGYFPIDDQPYTDRDVLANIANFLLAYRAPAKNSRLSASLNKALFLLQTEAFRYKWKVSRRTFQSFWHANGAAAPFLYIERFHSGLDWGLDPASKQFVEDVDDLLENPEEVRSYFARCRWAVEQLAAQLDSRALSEIAFPRFPPHLAPELVSPTALSPVIEQKLRGYEKSYKYL